MSGPATAVEWRDYLPVWRGLIGGRRLRVVMTDGGAVDQDTRWRWARATPAGRAVLRNGVAEYRLGSVAEADAWMRNWNRYARPEGA